VLEKGKEGSEDLGSGSVKQARHLAQFSNPLPCVLGLLAVDCVALIQMVHGLAVKGS
jgi:hypothetical protein